MTSIQQRAELQRRIWQIANDVRGAVDGWDFKQYVLGALFYRFISENFASYIAGGDDSIRYAALSDRVITPDLKDDAIIFAAIESSASGYPSERDIKGLFADFDTTSNRLGNTVKDKNARLAAVLKGVAELDFGDFDASHIDLFGDDKLSVSSYIEAKDTREVVDLAKLNAELKTTVARIDQLRAEIDAIVARIEGEAA